MLEGSAAGQDGRSSALTAPNGPAQQEVLRAALASAGRLAADMAVLQASSMSLVLPIEARSISTDCCMSDGSVPLTLAHAPISPDSF